MPFRYVVGEVVLSNFPQELSGGRHWFRRYNKLKFHINLQFSTQSEIQLKPM